MGDACGHEGEAEQNPKARYGYSRDKRPDCKQVVIALIVTPAGLPLAYEVMAGNTSEKTTLRGFPDRIESLYGKARRVWLMDRCLPGMASYTYWLKVKADRQKR